ncbi:4-fold beta flower protein [Methylobacterium planeticum]|uniref:4-fold beta flower domain-containing protein n=1 Tax=Methylobacterium planeticum TaxID=2615211 RepID=A0A6N6MGE6_9HYPH|nr:hypothetical protein [Methylobacterium planeticum]KAB1069967.1 hypothetical protein F6X51_24335 [Methylobacterium planeticum]
MIDLFDHQGRAAAFCDGRTIYFWDGRAAAYLVGEEVFSFSGRFIGWLTDGWVVDPAGHCLLFEFNAVRGPGKPARDGTSPKAAPRAPPPRHSRQAAPPRPAGLAEWSDSTFADRV